MKTRGALRIGATSAALLACTGCPQTDPDGSIEGMTDTATSGTDTDDVPSACMGPPQTQAELAWAIDGWPSFDDAMGGFAFDGEVACSVAGVAADGPPETALDCEEEGTAFSVVLSVPEAAEGRPAWLEGDDVVLRLRTNDEENDIWVLSMRRPSGELLLTGLDSPTLSTDEFFSGVEVFLDPLETSVSAPCGGAEGTPVEVLFLRGESTVALLGGERGSVAAGEDEVFAIDLSVAEHAICCSATYWYTAVIQRVVPG